MSKIVYNKSNVFTENNTTQKKRWGNQSNELKKDTKGHKHKNDRMSLSCSKKVKSKVVCKKSAFSNNIKSKMIQNKRHEALKNELKRHTVGHNWKIDRMPLSHPKKMKSKIVYKKSNVFISNVESETTEMKRHEAPHNECKKDAMGHKCEIDLTLSHPKKMSDIAYNKPVLIDNVESEVIQNKRQEPINNELKKDAISSIDKKKSMVISELKNLILRCQAADMLPEELDSVTESVNTVLLKLDAIFLEKINSYNFCQ